ncbi:MAG: methyl-accepting chemotaxis protein [Phormidesmis sp.]
MTAQQFSSEDQLPSSAIDSVDLPLPDPDSPRNQVPSTVQVSLNKGRTLNRQLLQTLLPAALLPLVVASGLSIAITRQSEREDILFLLQEESFLASEASKTFVENNFNLIDGILVNPILTQALNEASATANSDGLLDRPVDALEQQFSQSKLVSPDATLNSYLANVATVEEMAELFVTERNGFNVAYSGPTSDFVQRDEDWWVQARDNVEYIEPVAFDESSGVLGVSLAKAITDPSSGQFQGVAKAVVSTDSLNEQVGTYVSKAISGTQQVQVVDTRTGVAFLTIDNSEETEVNADVVGGESIVATAQALSTEFAQVTEAAADSIIEGPAIGDLAGLEARLSEQASGKVIDLEEVTTLSGETFVTLLTEFEGRTYSLTAVTGTPWVAIASAELAEINAAGRNLLIVYVFTALVMGTAITFFLQKLAGQLSRPLQRLTETAQQVTSGDLDARANLQGTLETQVLGRGFNNLLDQLQSLLSSQSAQTAAQRHQRELLEEEITQLMEDVGDAAEGDLSVRAQLSEGDVGIVADLINAIVENLRDIAVNVKQSTSNVSESLSDNEQRILALADEAVEEARSMQSTMSAVEKMGQSIQTVASNANQASLLTDDTYVTVQAGSESIGRTAESILELRTTVGETSKKIKRLGESAQKIAQAVGLIDSIALKTNLLAVNASVEAARAGELGQGFTAVAEQVSALAEQSAGATKTIAQIVAEIQKETQDVVAAIETGTAQVVDSSNLVKSTQQQLEDVLAKSSEINQLMQGISDSTVDQTRVSAAVTELIQKATQSSQARSQTSAQLAKAIQDTAQVAQQLQASVEQFKVVEK